MLSTGSQVQIIRDFEVGHQNKVRRPAEDSLWT